MHRVLAFLLAAAVVACESPPRAEPVAGPSSATPPSVSTPHLPAADPVAPSLEVFTAEATAACATARAVLDAAPLRGDPLTSYARQRDVRAALQHYNAAARGWDEAAARLFAFGSPDDDRGQRLIAALDVLAMRSRQVAEALAQADTDSAQEMLGALEHARYEADAAARELGMGPLSQCGEAASRAPGRQRVIVNAVDFGFRVVDDAVEPGATRFVLRNRGTEAHQLFVVALREPGSVTAAVAADRRGEPLAPFLAEPGAATAVAWPGERVTVDVKLKPGAYGLVCYVASPDGTPHAFKGMVGEVTVAS